MRPLDSDHGEVVKWVLLHAKHDAKGDTRAVIQSPGTDVLALSVYIKNLNALTSKNI